MNRFYKLKEFFNSIKKLGTDEFSRVRKGVNFAFSFLSALAVFLTLFAPICIVIEGNVEYKATAAAAFSYANANAATAFFQTFSFALIFILVF